MIESGYYPPGAEYDPRAPWNEKEIPERTVEIFISQTLSKSTEVTTSTTDWEAAYKEEHLTPIQLIEKFKEMLTTHLPDPISDTKRYMKFKHLIKECENWVEDETEILKD